MPSFSRPVVVHPNPFPIWVKGICYLFAVFFILLILYPMTHLIFSDLWGALALLVGYFFLSLPFVYFMRANFKAVNAGKYFSSISDLVFEYTKGVFPGTISFPKFSGSIDGKEVRVDFVKRGTFYSASSHMRIPIYGAVLNLPLPGLVLKDSFLVSYHVKKNSQPDWIPSEIWQEFQKLYTTKKWKHEIFLSQGLMQYVEENWIDSVRKADRFLAVIEIWRLWIR